MKNDLPPKIENKSDIKSDSKSNGPKGLRSTTGPGSLLGLRRIFLILLILGLVALIFYFYQARKGPPLRVKKEPTRAADFNLARNLSFSFNEVERLEWKIAGEKIVWEKNHKNRSPWGSQANEVVVANLLNFLMRVQRDEIPEPRRRDVKDAQQEISLFSAEELLGTLYWDRKTIFWGAGDFENFGTQMTNDQWLLMNQDWKNPLDRPDEWSICRAPIKRIKTKKHLYVRTKTQWESPESIEALGDQVNRWLAQFCEIKIKAQYHSNPGSEFQKVDFLEVLDDKGHLTKFFVWKAQEEGEPLYSLASKDGELYFLSDSLNRGFEDFEEFPHRYRPKK